MIDPISQSLPVYATLPTNRAYRHATSQFPAMLYTLFPYFIDPMSPSITACSEVIATCDLPSPHLLLRRFAQTGLPRQILIFECAPSASWARRSQGMGLIELAGGRVFFFRTNLAVMTDETGLRGLVHKLERISAWNPDWNKTSDLLETPIEFTGRAPTSVENWNIAEWRCIAASWLATHEPGCTPQGIGAVVANSARKIDGELNARIGEFMQALDFTAPLFLDEYKCSWISGFNYFAAENEQQRRNRGQVDTVFPILIEEMFACPDDRANESIIAAIDDGIPLVDHLAGLFNCHKKCIRHLVGLRYRNIGLKWVGRLRELLMILNSLDLNRLPKGEQEWMIFEDTIELLAAMTRMPSASLSNRMLLGEISKQHWNRKLVPSADFAARAMAIESFAENFRQAILATIWVNKLKLDSRKNLQQVVISSVCALGLTYIEKISRKWMAQERRLDSEQVAMQTGEFPILLDSQLGEEELRIVQLKTTDELIREGERMNNCVSDYACVCAYGSSFVFSVRDASDTPRVSVEYSLVQTPEGLLDLELIQQQGHGNSAPKEGYLKMLNLLKCHLSSPVIRIRLLKLASFRKSWQMRKSDAIERCTRSLEFIRFLEEEGVGRLDLAGAVAKVTD